LAYLQSYFAIHEQFSVPYHQHAMYIAYQQQQYLSQLETVLQHFTNASTSSASSSSSGASNANNANSGAKNYKRQFFIPSTGLPPILQSSGPPIKSPRVFPGFGPSSLNRNTSSTVAPASVVTSSSPSTSSSTVAAAISLSRVMPSTDPPNVLPVVMEDSVSTIIAKTVHVTLENNQVMDLGLPAFSGAQPQFTLVSETYI
jgi:hypothetical protein